MNTDYRISLKLLDFEETGGQAREVLERAKKALGFIPNMYAAMANASGLLDTYLHGYEQFRQHSDFSLAEQEVVFLAISRQHACHYCVAAHSMLADQQSGVPVEVTNAIREGGKVPDGKLAALAEFVKVMVDSRGNPGKEDVKAFLDAGYREKHILDIVLAQGVKTLSNFSNHLFHTPVDEVFAHRAWES